MANPRPLRRRWWKVVAALLAMLLVALGIGGRWLLTQVLPYSIVGTVRLERTLRYAGVTPASVGLRADALSLQAASGVELKGYFVRAEGTRRGTVLLLHGHNSCKEAMLPLAKRLAVHGFNSLVYDSRGCGESGGRFCTYGYYEKGDCPLWVDELMRRYGEDVGPVSIYGNSFGGAVALQAMAQDRRFRCGIVESTFATLREVVHDYEQHLTGVRLDALTDVALARGGELAHFPPDAVKPEEAAALIRCPVMIVHGTKDRDIPYHNGERIYGRLTAEGSRWYPIEGADHGNLWSKGGDAYEQAFLGFLEAHGT